MKQKIQPTTTTAIVDKDLLTHERSLKVLAGAVELLRQRALPLLLNLRIFVGAQLLISLILHASILYQMKTSFATSDVAELGLGTILAIAIIDAYQ